MLPSADQRPGLYHRRWTRRRFPSRTRSVMVAIMLLWSVLLGDVPWRPAYAQQYSHFAYLPLIVRPASTTVHPYATRVIELVNQERAKAGCASLAMNTALHNAALGHSEDMARNDFFGHTGSDGSSPWDRMTRAGYQWSRAGENIAAGHMTPEAVMQDWMGSAGHRANILNCGFRDIGVGYTYLANDADQVNYRHYWTQDFGAPR